MQRIEIHGDHITLGQLLKLADCIPTGGAAKVFLRENVVLVNGIRENRRGRKLKPQDAVEIPGVAAFRIAKAEGKTGAPGAPEA